ncbi:unnamed protein product [Rotaria magnacalcarata]|uniref:Macro domain-containing protein n=1 Tax=Rotaria magnacalcarata TaxID=392030 RepID=A0A816UAV9_9BILA|nr:unnamed protein product [Rotaria magnacalcarata]CAF1642038.1 unnamed protein product [Rotaria magnacalcarata]CAF1928783.1 unnamed protein product [Rotaria magnacalcarata]CAF2107886.1 unnamed protein product [Rotaria magnacalcarata]CAF3814400.1 unnamed protein product [Rotaria magnacalcarata]
MDTPIVLSFYVKPSSDSIVIRSMALKEYFLKLTLNVEVLYPTQVHGGLLLCKSKRTEEKISNMRHVLPNGSTIHLVHLTYPMFQQMKCTIGGQTLQSNHITSSLRQCLPFLHAANGKIHVNADKSVVLEGHIFILNAIHSFLLTKTSIKERSNNSNLSESINVSSRYLTIKVQTGKLIEQNVETILIPMNDKYRIHKAFDRQIQTVAGTFFSNYFKKLKLKSKPGHEGDIILLPSHGFNIPAKVFAFFIVPRLSNGEVIKDKSSIDLFQTTYERMICHALQSIDQHGITNIAMPILEPSVKFTAERRNANEMTARAMICAIRQYSLNSLIKLKRIIIVDYEAQIKRMGKRVKKYHTAVQKSLPLTNNIDFDGDDGQSFAYIFGVPKIPEIVSSESENDNDIEVEEDQLPYKHHTKV